MLNIAVFASGRGSNFDALYAAIAERKMDARIVALISNNSGAGALEKGRSLGIPAYHISRKQFGDDAAFAHHLLDVLRSHATSLIVLAGYMKRIDAVIIREYHRRIINIHPALLPKFGGAGMFGMHVHEAVIAAGEKESGATVHHVTEEYDEGTIIAQERVPVLPGDTPEVLAQRVLAAEHRLLPSVVEQFANASVNP